MSAEKDLQDQGLTNGFKEFITIARTYSFLMEKSAKISRRLSFLNDAKVFIRVHSKITNCPFWTGIDINLPF